MRATGYLVESILWHLMEEGTATLARLSELIGCPRDSIYVALRKMRVLGQVQFPKHVDPGDGRFYRHGLTDAGIAAALMVERKDVEFADAQDVRAAA